MKRKITTLEEKLISRNYKLEKKTYIGKNRDKVYSYTYSVKVSPITYYVELDKTREKIINFSFINDYYPHYDFSYIDYINKLYMDFVKLLESFYDFHEQDVIEPCPFVEESGFDD